MKSSCSGMCLMTVVSGWHGVASAAPFAHVPDAGKGTFKTVFVANKNGRHPDMIKPAQATGGDRMRP